MTDQASLDRRLMLSFDGMTLPDDVENMLADHDVSGVTLFRPHNCESPGQLSELTAAIQNASSSDLALLIALDQEGGQLHAFGAPATMWPGNMALGAANDPDLTRRVATAIGTELRSVGVNVDYAPNADLTTNPNNPATGARSFGERPSHVATHVGAFVEGLQSVGVAATMKHFPGKGDSSIDSHHGLPILDHSEIELREREFVPFAAAIASGVQVAMTGHVAIPSMTGSRELPGTLSRTINTGLLRDELGFEGVLITDALDMKSLSQGLEQVVDVISAVRSGVDLLLMTADAAQQDRVTRGLAVAASRGLIAASTLEEADGRVLRLRRWVSQYDTPSIDTVGSADHAELCLEASAASITLVKDDKSLLPLSLTASVLVVETEPTILTPADTSNYEVPYLADEVRRVSGGVVTRVVVPHTPTAADVASVVKQCRSSDIVVVGTVAANLEPAQGVLVEALIAAHDSVVAVSRRTPWDVLAYGAIGTYVCAWSANALPTRATASALYGDSPITGKLPTTVSEFPVGHGLVRG